MATENNSSVVPIEEMNTAEVKETSSNLNISLTARERLMKKLQGISTMVTITICMASVVANANSNYSFGNTAILFKYVSETPEVTA